jgi:alanine racemase
MDLIAVDVTDVSDAPPRRGDFVTLIGGSIDIDQVGQWSRTISYDVLTRLGRRYHRIWKS